MYDLYKQDNNEITNQHQVAMTRVKKRTQQSRAAGRLGGRPRSTVQRQPGGEAGGFIELSVDSQVVEEVNSKLSRSISIDVEVIKKVNFQIIEW